MDRLHAGMLLQASGRTEALRTLIRAEQDRGPDFLRLSNALSALYPRDSEEKRLLDGMLLATPGDQPRRKVNIPDLETERLKSSQ